LIVAAGSGSRAGGGAQAISPRSPASRARPRGRPLRHPEIDEIQVVIGAGPGGALREAIGDRALPSPIGGGASGGIGAQRARGDRAPTAAPARILIHDAARPFLPGRGDRPAARRPRPGMTARCRCCRSSTRWRARERALGDTVRARAGPGADAAGLPLRRDPRRPSRLGGGEATDDAQIARAPGSRSRRRRRPALEKLTYEEDFAGPRRCWRRG
jgi:2-C-methyl-D-erythritol 4-phosphate cytidylyltransferase/2-C-methyl-D-erythritol 2,4-cyclodiphosphate synthase